MSEGLDQFWKLVYSLVYDMDKEEEEVKVDWRTREKKWGGQIDLFKKTDVYKRYRAAVTDQDRRNKEHILPLTPRLVRNEKAKWRAKDPVISVKTVPKRSFDGTLKRWKRLIYEWDQRNQQEAQDSSSEDPDLFIPEQFLTPEPSPEKRKWSDIKCLNCGSEAHYKCTGCYRVAYCSFSCRNEVWPSHERFCNTHSEKRMIEDAH